MTNKLPLTDDLIKRLRETEQNPKYHAEGSVLDHTQMVLDTFLALKDQYNLSEEEKEIMYWACILHDIGKPDTTSFNDGRWRSPGHEKAGVPIARDILMHRPEISGPARRKILDLVRWHGLPLWWVKLQKPTNDLKSLGTRIDLRMLAIFAEFDFRGRLSEDHVETLNMIQDFRIRHVPKVEYEMGKFHEVQEKFKGWDITRKNAAWKAVSMENMVLLQKLLESTESLSDPLHHKKKVYVTIGPPLSGKTSYLTKEIPGAFKIDLADFNLNEDEIKDEFYMDRRLVELKHYLPHYIRKYDVLTIEGRNLDLDMRTKLNHILRSFQVEINYLIFESRLIELLERNKNRQLPFSEELIRNQYKNLYSPHPWEAHAIHWVEGSGKK